MLRSLASRLRLVSPLAAAPARSSAYQRLWAVSPAIVRASKIPYGFRRFFPDGAPELAKEGDGKNDPSSSSSSSGRSSHEKPGGGNDKSPWPNWETHLTLAILTALGLTLSSSRITDGEREITFQEFRKRLLEPGLVDRIVVMNKQTARVYLRPSRTTTPTDRYRFEDDAEDAAPARRASLPDDAALMDLQAPRAQYYFTIGSVETFENSLNRVQEEMGVSPTDFVPIKYVNRTSWGQELLKFGPTLLLIGFWLFIMRGLSSSVGSGGGIGGGMKNIFQIGKAPAVRAGKDAKNKVLFKDVAGLDEAKREVSEFVDFLKNPKKYTQLGAKIPRGALLVGPPGTGKTMLARATAAEASVPFFSISGSDFIEMFVGVGPSRVRDLFAQAREAAPCIVFIDEIDAVGRARGKGGFSGGNDERENTLNQLLVEMDGFSTQSGVVVLAGTNRVDILDKALLRPGRFDRQVAIDLPDIKGRQQIFKVHLKPLSLANPVDDIARRLASLTPGFSGADIANICNEAALIAARTDKQAVELVDFEAAVDRVIGGLAKENKIMTKQERELVAHHEAGHAVVGWFLRHADPLLKVTIVPRGTAALGFAQYLPKELNLMSEDQLRDMMCMALGGRASEQVFFDEVSTGAADDLKKITRIAYSTVTLFGMSKRVGNLSFPLDESSGNPAFYKPYSEKTAELIDEEVRSMVDQLYDRTLALVAEKRVLIEALAARLLVQETVTHKDLVEVLGERPYKSQQYIDYVEETSKEIPTKEDTPPEPAEKADAAAQTGTDDLSLKPA
ncbi:AAA+ ATPase domain-containing protein [Plasmodiophora brassicae]